MRNIDTRAIVVICVLLLTIAVLIWAAAGLFFALEDVVEEWNFPTIEDVFSGGDAQAPDFATEISNDLPIETLLTLENRFISGMAVQGDVIYFIYADFERENEDTDIFSVSHITVERISSDGQDRQRTLLPWVSEGLRSWWVVGFDVTEVGYFRFFIEERRWADEDDEIEVLRFYAEYDTTGKLVHWWPLSNAEYLLVLLEAIFTPDGDLVLHGFTEEGGAFYVLGRDGVIRGSLDAIGEIVRARDGRIFMFAGHMWEVGVETAAWGEVIGGAAARDMHPTQRDALFDLYGTVAYSTGSIRLYGYHLDSGERTRIFDWDEFGLLPQRQQDTRPGEAFEFVHLGFLPDGRVVVLREREVDELWQAELFLISP